MKLHHAHVLVGGLLTLFAWPLGLHQAGMGVLVSGLIHWYYASKQGN